jgi:carbamoyl-phosphate synthase small subunit
LGAHVTVAPYDTGVDEILERKPDLLLVSPGPGDPADLPQTVETVRALIGRLPIYGICLGHQVLGLACGARSYKLPYGHRGGNHPVKDLITGRVLVTAHNHGYAVDAASLPSDLESTMLNLNDGTNEGFRHRRLPIEGVQFHPEASPGPLDASYFFERWLRSTV